MKCVILAGGKGTRLRPYTTVFPKPLVPIGDKPILEIILRQLKAEGLEEVILSVGHLSELIMSFFGDGTKLGMKIEYVREDKPLGTAGALGLIKDRLRETFLMINGDTLTELKFQDIIKHHKNSGAIATIALKRRLTMIDFGVVEINSEGNIDAYIEKPSAEHLVSMGVYVFEPVVLDYIQPGNRLDFPDLVQELLANNHKISAYVFDGFWLDIGRPEDYQKANEDISRIYPMLLGESGDTNGMEDTAI